MSRYLIGAAVAVLVVGSGSPLMAQDGREAQMLGFRDFCEHGAKKACVRFGMMLQQNADRQAEWRHSHPDWFFFER